MTTTVRTPLPEEWREARRLRLEMLADTPIAYGRTLAWAQSLTDEQWVAQAARLGDENVRGIVAVDPDGRWLGQVVALDKPGETPGIVSVYLTPAARGVGLLGRMLDEACAWLRSRGVTRVHLRVHEDNHRAIRAYERYGFRPTGGWNDYVNDPARRELAYALDLA